MWTEIRSELKMKKMKVNFKISVPDDFKPGDCKHCPLHSTTEWESSYQCYETTIKCYIGFSSSVCPLEDVNPITGMSIQGVQNEKSKDNI